MVLSYAICTVSVASLRKEAAHRSEQLSELLYGERVEILRLEGDYWALVRNFADEYEGWCLLGQLHILTKKQFYNSSKFIVVGHQNKLSNEGASILLPMGSLIQANLLFLGGQKAKYKGKKVENNTLYPTPERIVEFAYAYKNAPYLWGGRTIQGIDCSGLSQIVLRLNGVQIARDASQQANQGQTVAFLQEARCGDLAFFGNAEGKINHVGILLNEHTIIHATETAGSVVIDKIDQEGIVSKLLRKRTHSLRLIKRYF